MTTTAFLLRPGTLEDWQKLIDACTDSSPERIVYLWSLDAQVDDMAVNLDALLHLTQALESAQPASETALGLGDAECSSRGVRSATHKCGASTGHWIDPRHSQRTFQSVLARDRSSGRAIR